MEDFKNRNKRYDAWSELDEQMEAGQSETKLHELFSQFNRECRKAVRSGNGAGNSGEMCYFKSILFLKDRNKLKTSVEEGILL